MKLIFLQLYKQPTRYNSNNFINNFNQLNIFRAIISPILKSTRLCLQLVVKSTDDAACWQHRRSVLCTTSCKHSLVLLRMGEIIARNTWCGNKETGLLLLLISGLVDDEEEGRALTRGLPSTVTQRFIHAHRLVWP